MVPIRVSVRNFGNRGGQKCLCVWRSSAKEVLLSWGEAHFRSIHSRSDGHVSLSHVGLNTFWPKPPRPVSIRYPGGKLSVDTLSLRHASFSCQSADDRAKSSIGGFPTVGSGSREPVDGAVFRHRRNQPGPVEAGAGNRHRPETDIRAWLAEDRVINFNRSSPSPSTTGGG